MSMPRKSNSKDWGNEAATRKDIWIFTEKKASPTGTIVFNNFYRDGGQVSDDLIGQFVFCRYRQLFDPFMFKFCWLECVRDSFYHHPFFCVKVTEKEKERRTEERRDTGWNS